MKFSTMQPAVLLALALLPMAGFCGVDVTDDIYLPIHFVDTEGNEGIYQFSLHIPGAVQEVEFQNGQKITRLNDIGGEYEVESGFPQATPYLFHLTVPGFDGPAMGYNYVGFFSATAYTVPLAASQNSEFKRKTIQNSTGHFYAMTVFLLVADDIRRPSLVLMKPYSEQWFDQIGISGIVDYQAGSSFFPRKDFFFLAAGDVQHSHFSTIWGDFPDDQVPPELLILDSQAIPTPPLQQFVAADGYTTATLSISSGPDFQHEITISMLPTDGAPNASALSRSIGGETPPPPDWITERAITEKLRRKVKWLYPPLDHYADLNGDGAIDAADLVLVLEKKREGKN
ncbi:hypothetical protein BH09SUM1_BH09SUM1_07880 [soil metagenome]